MYIPARVMQCVRACGRRYTDAEEITRIVRVPSIVCILKYTKCRLNSIKIITIFFSHEKPYVLDNIMHARIKILHSLQTLHVYRAAASATTIIY